MPKLDDLTINVRVSDEDIDEIIDRAVDRAIEKFEKKQKQKQEAEAEANAALAAARERLRLDMPSFWRGTVKRRNKAEMQEKKQANFPCIYASINSDGHEKHIPVNIKLEGPPPSVDEMLDLLKNQIREQINDRTSTN